jgi:hypothetical protein
MKLRQARKIADNTRPGWRKTTVDRALLRIIKSLRRCVRKARE